MGLFLVYRLAAFLAERMPWRLTYAAAEALAVLEMGFLPRDRQAVAENLEAVLGKLPPADRRRLVKEVFRNFARYLVEFLSFSKMDRAFLEKRFRFTGKEHLDEALGRGRGVILISAHVGNWELGGAYVSLRGYPLSVVALPHADGRVTRFFTEQRTRKGMDVILLGGSARRAFSALKANRILALLGDRDFTARGFVLPFFGRETLIPRGPALLSIKTGAPILPCSVAREGDGFHLAVEHPVSVQEPSGSDEESRARNLTAVYLTRLEAMIRRYPTQWYLFRRFWDPVAVS